MSKTKQRRENRNVISSVREPDIYAATSPHSWLRDLAAVTASYSAPGVDFVQARDRLSRHATFEQRKRLERAQKRAGKAAATGARGDGQGGAFVSYGGSLPQERDLSLTAGAGGEWSPPIWLLDKFASIARTAAPLLKAIPSAPLPEAIQQVFLPRTTAANNPQPQGAENTNPPDFWNSTDEISCEIVTISGILPMSTQFWERAPGIDGYLVNDFAEAYAASVESQIVSGTGTDGQLLGWLNLPTNTVDGVPGANAISYTSTTPTTAGIVAAIGQAAAAVGNTRLRPADCVVLTPERYSWLASFPDGSGDVAAMRPGTGRIGGDTRSWGPIAGLPAFQDAAIPQNLGSSGDQDAICVARAADSLLLEADPLFTVMVDTVGGPEQLTVLAQYHAYLAFFANRYPSAIATVTGTGLSRSTLWS